MAKAGSSSGFRGASDEARQDARDRLWMELEHGVEPRDARVGPGPDRDVMSEARIKELQHLFLEPGINSGARGTISGAGQTE